MVWGCNRKREPRREKNLKTSCAAQVETVKPRSTQKKIRYAVVGLGHIAQVAVLPAFKHARRNSELTALVSGDAKKREVLAQKYHVRSAASYDQYDNLLRSGDIDAVYIRCLTIFTLNIPFAPLKPEFTFCVKNLWRSRP